jgi:hypothetical protein
MEALLAEMPPTPGNLLDLLRGAFDARVRGDWPGRRRRRPRSLAKLLSTVAAAIGLLAATGVGLLFFVPQLGVVAPALGSSPSACFSRPRTAGCAGGATGTAATKAVSAAAFRRSRLRTRRRR